MTRILAIFLIFIFGSCNKCLECKIVSTAFDQPYEYKQDFCGKRKLRKKWEASLKESASTSDTIESITCDKKK